MQHASAIARASACQCNCKGIGPAVRTALMITSTACRRSNNFLISLSCREMAVWK